MSTTYSPKAEPQIPQSLSRSARHGDTWPTHRAKARNQRHRSNRKTTGEVK